MKNEIIRRKWYEMKMISNENNDNRIMKIIMKWNNNEEWKWINSNNNENE